VGFLVAHPKPGLLELKTKTGTDLVSDGRSGNLHLYLFLELCVVECHNFDGLNRANITTLTLFESFIFASFHLIALLLCADLGEPR